MEEKHNTSPDSMKEAIRPSYPYSEGLQVSHNQEPFRQEPFRQEPFHQEPFHQVARDQSSPTIQSPQSAYEHEHSPQDYKEQPKREGTCCGLRRSTFLLCLALVAVIIAAAVGGGVAGTMAVKNARNECAASGGSGQSTKAAETVTVTATAGSPASTGDATATASSRIVAPTGTLALDCPGLDDQGQQIATIRDKSWRFTATCDSDYPGNDIAAAVVYSFSDCLRACASHNYFVKKDECIAVWFTADMKTWIENAGGNCYLKNATSGIVTSQDDLRVTGLLVASD